MLSFPPHHHQLRIGEIWGCWGMVSENISKQLWTAALPSLAKQNVFVFVFLIHTVVPAAEWSVTKLQGGNFGP